MYKLGSIKNDEEQQYSYSDQYTVEKGYERIVIGLSTGHIGAVTELAATLNGPFYVLYVLHTPRAGGEPGRYQSKALTYDEFSTLLERFKNYFEHDSRHDLWLHSPGTNTTIVYDRHNLIYLYGFTNDQLSIIEQRGLERNPINMPVPHVHHYHADYDVCEAQIIGEYEWVKSPLRDEDRQ